MGFKEWKLPPAAPTLVSPLQGNDLSPSVPPEAQPGALSALMALEAPGLTGLSPRAAPWASFKAPGGAESIEGEQPGSNLATLPPAPAQHGETAARKATGCGSGSRGPSWLGAVRGDVEVAAKQEGSSQVLRPSASQPEGIFPALPEPPIRDMGRLWPRS